MKTHQVLNRLNKCAKPGTLTIYHYFTIKTKKIQYTILDMSTKKKSLRNLRFHGGFFELEIPESFTRVFLLKTIIWT